uniref:Fibronectin type III domain containing 11 n=1 Tax=Leptobrachium leishanense TaxID=445787 RepID=A0A8C5MLS2_9ANUR
DRARFRGLGSTCPNSMDTVMFMEEEMKHETFMVVQERKNTIMEFLNIKLNDSLLIRCNNIATILKKSSFYIEMHLGHLVVGYPLPATLPETVLDLIVSQKFKRMKMRGNSQTKIQLLLLDEYLEQLEKGRRSLLQIIQSGSTDSYLVKWEEVSQHMTELSIALNNFLSMVEPCRLHIKNHLLPFTGATNILLIQIRLITKTPVVFNRLESVVYDNSVCLKLHTVEKQDLQDICELHFKLQKPQTPLEMAHSTTFTISTNCFLINHLLPNRLYEFTVRRAETAMLVYEEWHDTLTLKTLMPQ